jgi:hypothetical protein
LTSIKQHHLASIKQHDLTSIKQHHLASIKQHHLTSIKQHQLASIKQHWRKPPTCRKSDKLYRIFLLYTSLWAGFEPTSVVIGSYTSNYHTITATTAPSSFRPFNLLNTETIHYQTLQFTWFTMNSLNTLI